jgi:hypothetical protein
VSAKMNENPCLEHANHTWRLESVEGGLKDHIEKDDARNSATEKRFLEVERTMFRFGAFVAVVNTIVGLVVSAVTVGGKLGWF